MTETQSAGPDDSPVLPQGGLPAGPLAELDHAAVEARSLPDSPTTPAQVRQAGLHLRDLWLPAVVLDAPALRHNLRRFADWCADVGVDLAPHGKTTMAPRLWSAQLASGAWGLTAATMAQVRIMRRFGARRVLLANEVADPGQAAWLARQLDDPGFEAMCLVDSADGVAVLERALRGAARPLPVLVELGVAGRRTGVRDPSGALDLARRVAASPSLRLAGLEAYEGVLPRGRGDDSERRVEEWLERIAPLARRADDAGLFADADEIILTAGGSNYPDLAAAAITAAGPLSRPVRPVVRSGGSLTHDHRAAECTSPLRTAVTDDPLRPALRAFARVLSCPEPGRALLGGGRRDLSFDVDLPIPLALLRGERREPLGESTRVVELNDHHAFLDLPADAGARPRVGDVVELGMSHPCTVFDKWPLLPVVEADLSVVDAVRTLF